MIKTYTQLHVHCVFAVKYRAAQIHHDWKEELHQYITGITKRNDHKMLQINSMPDHIHIFIGLQPNQSISSLIQNIKAESSKWINNKEFCANSFAWQEGYGAFTYAKSQVEPVIRYIQNQEIHHKKLRFTDEYKKILTASGVNWNEEHIFKSMQ